MAKCVQNGLEDLRAECSVVECVLRASFQFLEHPQNLRKKGETDVEVSEVKNQ